MKHVKLYECWNTGKDMCQRIDHTDLRIHVGAGYIGANKSKLYVSNCQHMPAVSTSIWCNPDVPTELALGDSSL